MAYQIAEQRRIDAGLCRRCGEDRGSNGTTIHCRSCADEHSARCIEIKAIRRTRWVDQADEGALLCTSCGSALPNSSRRTCEKCREYARTSNKVTGATRRSRKEAAGTCVVCTTEALHPSRYCRSHVLENALRRYGIQKDQYDDFWRLLVAQDFRCYYTGIVLVPGINLSLDHLTPRSRGGSPTDIANCVWCDRGINACKSDRTEDEFVSLCQTIVAVAGRGGTPHSEKELSSRSSGPKKRQLEVV